ncbi:hypothetical protein [Phytohabitans aurantiacus]|uniref:hypothetical protein n=1 Tax=Phytohabitans aurantiacus TaxID=3016789 RepID=UPI00249399A8|nr:hypothetical protein [Phytohabitans aurantiacus]
MRARLLAEFQLSSQTSMEWTGTGWLNTDAEAGLLRSFDTRLRPCCQIPVPDLDGDVHASAASDGSRFALVGVDGVTVINEAGRPLWHRPERIAAPYQRRQPSGHFDSQGRLWAYLPGRDDELAVLDPVDGSLIARTRLDTYQGAATFLNHPDGWHIGVTVAMGQDGTTSFWARLDGDRIHLRSVSGEILADIASTGDWYIDLPHRGDQIAVRDVADGTARISCFARDVPRFVHPVGYILNSAATLVTDEYLLVGVEPDDCDGDEQHLLLATDTLTHLATIDYPQPMFLNSITHAGGNGRWLTHNWTTGTSQLWSLPATNTAR